MKHKKKSKQSLAGILNVTEAVGKKLEKMGFGIEFVEIQHGNTTIVIERPKTAIKE